MADEKNKAAKPGVLPNKTRVTLASTVAKVGTATPAGAAVQTTTRIDAAAEINPSMRETIRLRLNPGYIRNLFEKTRPGKPVVRPDDLVALRIETVNMEVVPGTSAEKVGDKRVPATPPRLRKKGADAAYLILHFPPQSFAEETFFETPQTRVEPKTVLSQLTDSANKLDTGDEELDKEKKAITQKYVDAQKQESTSETPTAPPIRARIANESRLAFTVPDGFDIEYSLASVLDACRDLPLHVSAAAQPRLPAPAPTPSRTRPLISAAELAKLPVARRVALANAAANTLRLAATGDAATTRVRQLSIGAGVVQAAVLRDALKRRLPDIRRLLKPRPEKPDATTTSIEMPWRLILSPHEGARWRHATEAVTSSETQRTELWHSRMVTPHDDGEEIQPPYPDLERTTRAIWALDGSGILNGSGIEAVKPAMQNDWPAPASLKLPAIKNNPFRTTLSDFDRYQISHLSSNFTYTGYTPEPIDTNMMMLTALGGWLDSRGAWDPPGLSVEEWVHRATMGRDHYVKVVYRGFLFPFGHRVSLIKVSERKFHGLVLDEKGKPKLDKDKNPIPMPGNPAYLRQRMFMVIREKERTFDSPVFLNAKSNGEKTQIALQFPFTKVKLLTEKTPDIDDPNSYQVVTEDGIKLGQKMFWPHVNGKPFRFQCAAIDLDGRRVVFDLPAIFVDNTLAGPRDPSNHPHYSNTASNTKEGRDGAEFYAIQAMNAYKDPPNPKYNTAILGGQRVALAHSTKSGDTSVQVQEMTFGGFAEEGNEDLQNFSEKLSHPIWVPKVEQVKAKIGPIAHLTGSPEPNTLTYNKKYLKIGFDYDLVTKIGTNKGEVFVDVSAGPDLDFSSQGDKSGGFMQPNIRPRALSRVAGPVMGNPDEFFEGLMTKGGGFPNPDDPEAPLFSNLPLPLLFGCIPLGALIGEVDVANELHTVPKFVSEVGSKLESFISSVGRLYELVTNIASQPANIAKAALMVFKATLDDLIAQNKAYSTAQVPPEVVLKIQEVKTTIDELIVKLDELANKAVNEVDNAKVPGLSDLEKVTKAIGKLKDIVNARYKNGVESKDADAVSLPAGFRQSILNVVQKIDVVMTQLRDLQKMVSAGKNLWKKLDAIVSSLAASDNENILENHTLLDKLSDLNKKINKESEEPEGFEKTLKNFNLLDGAPRKAMFSALEAIKEINTVAELANMLTSDEVTIRFDWHPTIKSWGFDEANPVFRANDKNGLIVAVEAKVKKSGGSPKISVNCSLKHFDLVMVAPASFLELNFEKIEFSVDSASKKMSTCCCQTSNLSARSASWKPCVT